MIERLKDLKTEEIKNEILGKKYDLSVVFVSENKIKTLNKKYRKINKPTDVLSFSLSKNLGEIFICKKIAKKKASDFGMNLSEYLLLLVIHASLHLKGLQHGDKMKKYELTHHNRYRHRHL